jgi:DNA-binding NtrC family response regulator
LSFSVEPVKWPPRPSATKLHGHRTGHKNIRMPKYTLLAIDNEPIVLESLRLALPTSWRLLPISSQESTRLPEGHAALIDVHMHNLDKAESLSPVMKDLVGSATIEILAMSGDLRRQTMEACLRIGATRFLSKPLNVNEVVLQLEKIEAWHELRLAAFRHPDKKYFWIGSSKKSDAIKKQLARLRSEPGPILIEGETGSGKEVAARVLSQIDDRPFIAVNMGGIPESLLEAELFGFQKGSFTGAQSDRVGLAVAAEGGDLFLDEIQTMSLDNQVKLLRFLETGEVRPIGSNKVLRPQIRVITASNRNLETMVKDGMFREDLFWRLSRHRVELPPLRDRPEDIPELCNWFLSHDPQRPKEIDEEAMALLKTHPWPGNVRELKRLCEHLQLSAPLPLIRSDEVAPLLGPSQVSTFDLDATLGLEENVLRFEKKLIEDALREHSDVLEAADRLKVSRSTLYKKMKDLGIERDGP